MAVSSVGARGLQSFDHATIVGEALGAAETLQKKAGWPT